MKFKPIGERALVKPVEQEEKTASGIVLPETAKEEKPQTAKIKAIGDLEDGKVNEDDLVVFARYSGTEITLDNEDFLILDTDDLLGIVEE